jgi:MoaA/NifB/PqqE/SkfB family radical SAM enzyme
MEPSAEKPAAGLSGLHLLLTYECEFECDHCFVWGAPGQNGTMSDDSIIEILRQAREFGSIEWIYFEGGEAFMHHSLLCRGIQRATELGFRVGVVTNAFWAESAGAAERQLQPLAGLVEDFSISEDAYHGSDNGLRKTRLARRAADKLGIPANVIRVAQPGAPDAGEAAVRYRGRAAAKLASGVPQQPWRHFSQCPWEELRNPERLHVDSYGNLHVCQGISIGNLFERPLTEIMRDYRPDDHPVIGPLLDGGPAGLLRRYDLQPEPGYADACHLCYDARSRLRNRLADVLTPDQMYGELKYPAG